MAVPSWAVGVFCLLTDGGVRGVARSKSCFSCFHFSFVESSEVSTKWSVGGKMTKNVIFSEKANTARVVRFLFSLSL